jgi:hypothetical protein
MDSARSGRNDGRNPVFRKNQAGAHEKERLNMNVFKTLIFGLLKDRVFIYHLCIRLPAITIAGGAAVLMKKA